MRAAPPRRPWATTLANQARLRGISQKLTGADYFARVHMAVAATTADWDAVYMNRGACTPPANAQGSCNQRPPGMPLCAMHSTPVHQVPGAAPSPMCSFPFGDKCSCGRSSSLELRWCHDDARVASASPQARHVSTVSLAIAADVHAKENDETFESLAVR